MIFEIGRTSCKLTFSFVALIVLMLLLCDEEIVILSLCSSVIHESGHLFFMCITGDRPKSVELSLFGMRIDRVSHCNVSYVKEILIALGGIIFNLLFSSVCYIIFLISDKYIFFMLFAVNIVISIINSLPVGVLDLGRALKCLLLIFFDSEKSEKLLDCISYICVIMFSLVTLFYCFIFGINISLITVTLYLYFITIIKKWS